MKMKMKISIGSMAISYHDCMDARGRATQEQLPSKRHTDKRGLLPLYSQPDIKNPRLEKSGQGSVWLAPMVAD